MKFKDRVFSANREYVVIPRVPENFVFCLQPCDFKDFDKLCPEPKAPVGILPGGAKVSDVKNPTYLQTLQEHGERRVAFMIIQALKATDGFEWDSVNADDPNTWLGWKQEFYDAHFNEGELISLIKGAMAVNSLDSEKIEAARANFLLSLAEAGEAAV